MQSDHHSELKLIQKYNPYLNHFRDHAGLAGALYSYKNQTTGQFYIDHIPFSALPYKLSKKQFNKLVDAQTIWIKLFVRIVEDKQFINKIFSNVIKQDEFIKSLLKIYNEVQNPQKIQMNILRSDYMLDYCKNKSLMVQYNLLSVALTGLSDKIHDIQKLILSRCFPQQYKQEHFPISHNIETISSTMIDAINRAGIKGKIIMIVKDPQYNIYDQRAVEVGVMNKGNIIIRATFQQLIENLKLDENTLQITYFGQPIALFYLRDGYAPDTYKDQRFWKVREIIERSKALKVPTVAMQIGNAKRVQQQLCNKNVLLRYLNNEQSDKLLELMALMYNFQNEQGQKVLHSFGIDKIILKPNRQGGGNNYYGEKAIEFFKTLTEQQKRSYILMQRICPHSSLNLMFRHGISQQQNTISQISIVSTFIYDGIQILKQSFGGHMIRTKNESTDEGGVAIQASVLSGIYLQE